MSSAIAHIPIPTKQPLVTVDRIKPSKLMRRSTTCIGYRPHVSFQCHVKTHDGDQATAVRRSGNYKPTIWDFEFIQSLSSEYTEERYSKEASDLMVQVKRMLEEGAEIKENGDDVRLLVFIDDLQRLCISYHFQDKIKQILSRIYDQGNKHSEIRDLYSTALEFRLLRQHGFSVSQDVFDCFKNNMGGFKESLGDDTKGLLQLYEASFLLTQGENTLELANQFSTKFLQKETSVGGDKYLSLLVRQALELPLQWRVQRPNSRWFISAYERRPDNMNPIVLELAKLEFNIAQGTHQQELKCASRWWEETRLAEKLPFARDRLVECYLWTTGWFFEPKYRYSRIMMTKANALITTIDDVFDVYGTLEELQLFNSVIQRWDMEDMDKLPNYMQLCVLTLNNFINEMAYHVLNEQGLNIIPHLRKSWAELFRAYLQEAEWYSKGYSPTLEEYIGNAWISISTPIGVTHSFFLVTNPIKNEVVQTLYKYHNIVRCSSMINRLANDLGTSPDEMKRGDVPKAIQCYMNETGDGIQEAREHVQFMIYEVWKEMNEELQTLAADSPFHEDFVSIAVDIGRMAQYMYQYGDGHGNHFPRMKERILGLLLNPIPIV